MENVSQWTKNPSFDDPEVNRVIEYILGKHAREVGELKTRIVLRDEAIRQLKDGVIRDLQFDILVKADEIHNLNKQLKLKDMQIDKVAAERDALRQEREVLLKS